MRCFIAIDIPDDIKKNIEQTSNELGALHGIKKVARENLHITLRFLGTLHPKKAEQIKQKLREVKIKPFLIKLKGIGVFPYERRARVIWIDCISDELKHLALKINDVLAKDFPKEACTAHLTIARVKGKIDKGKIIEFLKKQKNNVFGSFICKEFELKESKLLRDGPVYTTLERYLI